MKNKTILAVLTLLIFILAGIFFFRFAKQSQPKPAEENNVAQIANPASVLCVKNGGKLDIADEASGQEYLCSFPNGQKCEEWAFFRGECNVEGISNTGIYNDGKNEVKVIYRMQDDSILLAPSFGYDYLIIKQAMSGSGARYLSSDGKVEFWEHQGEGKLSVDGKAIFTGKVQ